MNAVGLLLMLHALAVAADTPPPCFPITWSGGPSELGFTQATGIHNVWTDRDPQHQALPAGRLGGRVRQRRAGQDLDHGRAALGARQP